MDRSRKYRLILGQLLRGVAREEPRLAARIEHALLEGFSDRPPATHEYYNMCLLGDGVYVIVRDEGKTGNVVAIGTAQGEIRLRGKIEKPAEAPELRYWANTLVEQALPILRRELLTESGDAA